MTTSNGAGVDTAAECPEASRLVRMAGVPLYRPDRNNRQVSFPLLQLSKQRNVDDALGSHTGLPVQGNRRISTGKAE